VGGTTGAGAPREDGIATPMGGGCGLAVGGADSLVGTARPIGGGITCWIGGGVGCGSAFTAGGAGLAVELPAAGAVPVTSILMILAVTAAAATAEAVGRLV